MLTTTLKTWEADVELLIAAVTPHNTAFLKDAGKDIAEAVRTAAIFTRSVFTEVASDGWHLRQPSNSYPDISFLQSSCGYPADAAAYRTTNISSLMNELRKISAKPMCRLANYG